MKWPQLRAPVTALAAVALLATALAGPAIAGSAIAAPAPAFAAPAPAFGDADYFAFADRIATRLAGTWSPAKDAYVGSGGLEARYNAALLTIHATAALHGHAGPARNDARARALAARLTASPPFFVGEPPPGADSMFHSPGWLGTLDGGYSVMDKAIDPKIAEGLQAAWRARDAIGLPAAVAQTIPYEISQVAHTPFFRFPMLRLNQINWPLELAAYDASVTGDGTLLRTEYGLQARRFADGARRPWRRPDSATNLARSYRFHRNPSISSRSRTNLDSAEYANIVIHFLAFYDDARRAGMPAIPAADRRLLRGWVRRVLFGYWTHAGLLNWDTGMGYRRWMKGKFWAWAQQGLLAMAEASAFHSDPRYGAWAKTLFDRGLQAYDRMADRGSGAAAGTTGVLAAPGLYGVTRGGQHVTDARMFAARMGANAVRAVSAGLGRMPPAEPPPFYAFDADIGRLAVSTPAYSTAVIAVNRGAFPYGGVELARLFDGEGDPVGGIGGRPPAAFGVIVQDRRGRRTFGSQLGFRSKHAHSPLVLARSPAGPVRRVAGLRAGPSAGPFRVLEAVARRRSRGLLVVTRHRFGARAIRESWRVQRVAGRRFLRAVVQLPSWGREASVDAELHDGTVVALAAGGVPVPDARVPLAAVRRFELRGREGAYTVTPLRGASGSARALAVEPQPTAPDAGPTLELMLGRGRAVRRMALTVRITPRDSSGHLR